MRISLRWLALAAITGVTHVAFAAEPAASSANAATQPAPKVLGAGDKAPAFEPTAWLQGEPVAAFENGKVYLIELWATWCGPCIQQIPHLDALHKKYADQGLVVIGTNVWDKDRDTAENFVKKKAKEMTYRVAYDAQDGRVTDAWLKAGKVSGIPHAFAVRDGVILWRGHPGRLNDELLEKMLKGEFDVTAEAAKQRQIDADAARAKKERDDRLRAAHRAATDAIDAKNFELAKEKIAAFVALLPESGRPLENLKLHLRLYGEQNDVEKTVSASAEFVDKHKPNILVVKDLLGYLSKNKAVLSDPKGVALITRLGDKILADDFFGKNPSGVFLVAQCRLKTGDKAGALAALAILENAREAPPRLTEYLAKVKAAVEAGDAWPEK